MIEISTDIFFDDSLLEEEFIRAQGPGGQNVNKVSTAVRLSLPLSALENYPAAALYRLRKANPGRITAEDVLRVTCSVHRTQGRNREEALVRLIKILKKSLIAPKRRKKTAPSKASKERRLDTKRKRAQIKKGRSSGKPDY